MATPTTYLIERVVIDVDTAAYDCSVVGNREVRIDEGIRSELIAGSGELEPTTRGTTQVLPVITVRTMACKTILDALWGNSNKVPHIPIVTTVGGGSVSIYLQSTAAGGTRGGAGTNWLLKLTAGIIVPTRISGEPAEVELQIHGAWDGTNVPLQRTASQNLPAGSAGAEDLYRVYALKDNTTVLYQLDGLTLNFGIDVAKMQPASSLYGTAAAIQRFAPEITFQSADLATILAASGYSGASAGAGGLILYLAKYDEDGSVLEPTTGLTLTLRAGSFYYPQSIMLDAIPVKISYRAIGLGGTVAQPPLTYATGATIPAEASTKVLYMVGPIKEGSTQIESTRGTSFEFGMDCRVQQSESLLWPDRVAIIERRPALTLATLDVDAYAALAQGASATATIYCRKMGQYSEQIADASAVHVKITLNSAWWEPGSTGGAHPEDVPGQIRASAVKGVSDMLTLSTASAIT